MNRQKIVLGNYTYVVELYKARIDLKNPTYGKFFILREQDFMSGVTNDKHIYFINQDHYKDNVTVYPLSDRTHAGYSMNPTAFDENVSSENIHKHFYKLYKQNKGSFQETEILCDMIRIYFPIIRPRLDAILDVENLINDIKIHYLITDLNDYPRRSNTEFTYSHNSYSEYVDIYIPSLDTLLFNENIYIKDYNICSDNETGEQLNIQVDPVTSLIPFNILYYPYEIKKDMTDETPVFQKSYIRRNFYINTQFYSTLNVILYPYSGLDDSRNFVVDTSLDINSLTFNLDLSVTLTSEIKFPVASDFKDEREYEPLYGVPCIISRFNYEKTYNENIVDFYLGLNGKTRDDYLFYDPEDTDSLDYKEPDDEYFGEEYADIIKSGFYIEMSTDKRFSDVFFKYVINIDEKDIIDDLIFPLNNIFQDWDDVPGLILYRVTFIDKVSCIKITSNPVIITDEWYKYLVNNPIRQKLHFRKVYKKVKDNMIVGKYNDSENPILFIDKINCTVKKGSDGNGYTVNKKNSPKVIYKPIFYRTQDLQSINIKIGITQNIGINLDEYLTKVETFKLLLGNNEYIEYGRNNVYVIFNINGVGLTASAGKYIITNEKNEYISDGEYTIN